MDDKELLKLTPSELVDLGICPTCFNKKHNGALYGDNKDKLIYEDEDIECFFVGNPRSDGHMCISTINHYTTLLIKNTFIGSFFGNISYTVTTQLSDSEMFYSYSNVGNGGYSAGVGMNLGNWYGISAYVSSNIGFGTSMQLTPWITYGAEISLQMVFLSRLVQFQEILLKKLLQM